MSGTVKSNVSSDKPSVAVLLVGLPRGWNDDYVNDLRNGVVELHHADVFVHMCDDDGELEDFVKAIGSSVKQVQDECVESGPQAQFWHLRRAFNMMEAHETDKGSPYDVVIKMRTEISPAASDGGSLDLTGWEKGGRLHMMTDMLFWGQRKEMDVMADFYQAIGTFYSVDYPNPFDRPIDLKALYETYLRDPRCAPDVSTKAPWYAYNKLEAVPYPDGYVNNDAIKSLEAALEDGITECPSDRCALRCGERYATLCENGDDVCGKFGCKNHPDYATGKAVAEKDILTWPLSHGIIVCDVGKSFNPYRGKTGVQARNSRDCDE